MSAYQGTIEELNDARAKRNAEIRAWGKKQLEEADQTLLGVPTELSDWDDLIKKEEEEVTNSAKTPKPKTPKSTS